LIDDEATLLEEDLRENVEIVAADSVTAHNMFTLQDGTFNIQAPREAMFRYWALSLISILFPGHICCDYIYADLNAGAFGGLVVASRFKMGHMYKILLGQQFVSL
jgi:hypothetical protein